MFERMAIYWAPPRDSALAAFGRNWLGSDPERDGAPAVLRETCGLDASLAGRATESPRRYGLHGTLKAPMRLAPGRTAESLVAALEGFAARRRRFRAGPFRLARLARYLALVPQEPTADLDWLAQQCETVFDRFRAPLDDAEAARRFAPGLSARRRGHVRDFGYPFVLSDFLFHITLAGPLENPELSRVETALRPVVAPFCEEPLAIDAIALLGDPGGGAPFRMIARFPLLR